MTEKNYFINYKKGEAYAYGLKCISSEFSEDIREVIFVAKGEEKKIRDYDIILILNDYSNFP